MLAWVIAAGSSLILVWALFWDRSRGRQRCPKCWYDMSGNVATRCPECGAQVGSSRQLLKTRRRWWFAAVSLFTLPSAWFAGAAPAIHERGWWAAVPTTMLLYLWEPRGDDWDWDSPKTKLENELFLRRDLWVADPSQPEGLWWAWQRTWYCDRLLAAKGFEKQEPLVTTADSWPVDGHVFVRVRQPWILPYCRDMRVREKGGKWQRAHFGRGSGDAFVCLGPVPGPGHQSLTVELEALEDTLPLWRGRRTIEYVASGSVAGVVEPIDNQALTSWIANDLWIWADGLSIKEPQADHNAWHASLDLKVDVLRRSVPVATGYLCLEEGYVLPRTPIREAPHALALSWQPGVEPFESLPEWDEWTLHVSGVPELAAGTDPQTIVPVRVWSGQFTGSLRRLKDN